MEKTRNLSRIWISKPCAKGPQILDVAADVSVSKYRF